MLYADLMDPDDLSLDAVVLTIGATRPPMSWHVHSNYVLIFREVLKVKKKKRKKKQQVSRVLSLK